MSDIEKLNILRVMVNDRQATDETLTIYLDFARQVIFNKMYPYGIPPNTYDIPIKYTYDQLQIATYLYLKRGAEGEVTHNENGVTRTYESADIPESLLARIVPFVSVF